MMSDDKITGSCLCGQVKYEISGSPMFSAHCCCNSCKKASGADHITAAFFTADQVKMEGQVSTYSMVADSGNTSNRHFCPNCGSRMYSTNSAREGVMGLQVGTMDNPKGIKPRAVVYARDRNEWDAFNDALPRFDKMPPPPPGAD
jgi:hypothetical protein